jgi:hypothetical protein
MLRAMAGSCTARPPLKYRCMRRKRIPRCHATGGSFEFGAAARDFDSPLSTRHVEVQSGGSRSAGTRVYVDLGLYAHDAAYDAVPWAADGLLGKTFALWSPAPPSSAAIGTAMCRTLMGIPIARWFAQSVPAITDQTWRHAVLLAVVRRVSARVGRSPAPNWSRRRRQDAWPPGSRSARRRERAASCIPARRAVCELRSRRARPGLTLPAPCSSRRRVYDRSAVAVARPCRLPGLDLLRHGRGPPDRPALEVRPQLWMTCTCSSTSLR